MSDSELLGQPVSFVPTVDLARAAAFYQHILGLRVVSKDDFAVVISSGSSEIRVTAVPTLTPHPFTLLGWNVDDVGDVANSLSARGVEFLRFEGMVGQDERGIWSAPGGALVCWFHDPDGNTLSITQLP